MGKINVLGFDLANLIAAGEVVDRPASIVKELVENAIDAGSKNVTVEVRHGGVTLIKVTDNGCGMSKEDLPTAILRHATSKISTVEDLNNIMTLGFRGEALAAIAAVTKMKVISKTRDSQFGNIMEVIGGEIVSFNETGCSNGTTIICEDLFFNVPARRKFLKKDATELLAVTSVMEKIALSHPEVAIKYSADGEFKFTTQGNGKLYDTIYAIYGKTTATRLVEVLREENGIKVTGYTSEPDYIKNNRNFENIYINGRYIKSKTAGAALEQAYISRIASDKFPFCVINIEINPNFVDVNVHPSKLEVKFSNEKIIFDIVYYAIVSALEKEASRPEFNIGQNKYEAARPQTFTSSSNKSSNTIKPVSSVNEFWVNNEKEARKILNAFVAQGDKSLESFAKNQIKLENLNKTKETKIEKTVEANLPKETHQDVNKTLVQEENLVEEKNVLPVYSIIGEIFNCYVIVQLEDRILMIDKHAAHERILYEDMRKKMHQKEKHPQILMFPLEMNIESTQIDILSEYETEIRELGFDYLVDKKGKVQVSQIPEELNRESAVTMFETLIQSIESGRVNIESAKSEFFDKVLYTSACKAAIKGGKVYNDDAIKWIVERVICVPENGGSAIKTCPHGRPVAFELKKSTIERQFERLK